MINLIVALTSLYGGNIYHPMDGDFQQWQIHFFSSIEADTIQLKFSEDSPGAFSITESWIGEEQYRAISQYYYDTLNGFSFIQLSSNFNNTIWADSNNQRNLAAIPFSNFSYSLLGNLKFYFGNESCSSPQTCKAETRYYSTNTTMEILNVWHDSALLSNEIIPVSRVSYIGGGKSVGNGGPGIFDTVDFVNNSMCISVKYGSYSTGMPTALFGTQMILDARRLNFTGNTSVEQRDRKSISRKHAMIFNSDDEYKRWIKQYINDAPASFASLKGEFNRASKQGKYQFIVTSDGVYRVIILR